MLPESEQRVNGRGSTALWGFVVVVLVAVAGVAGYAIGTVRTPAQFATATPPEDFPVTLEPFSDLRRVRVQLTRGDPIALTLTGAGRVTKSACAPGTPIQSGTVTWSVEGEPMLSLHTSEPMHRDLAAGARGSDVAALQAELTRLGFEVANDGVFDPATERALDALRASQGVSQADGLTMAQVIWLPAPQIRPATCASLGAVLQTGDKIATGESPLVGAQVKPVPEGMTSGKRTLRIGDGTVAVTAEGQVPGEALAALALEPLVASALASPNDEALLVEARLELATPVEGASLPASAVLTNGGTCVVSGDDRVLAVAVLSSVVGQSIVSFAADDPPQSVRITPSRELSCG